MTDLEKEEDYEVRTHIITSNLDDTSMEEVNPLAVVTIPPTQQHEEEIVQTDEETQSDNLLPEYAMTKENICWLAVELSKDQ